MKFKYIIFITIAPLATGLQITVVMNTDQLTRPVQETEATHLYE